MTTLCAHYTFTKSAVYKQFTIHLQSTTHNGTRLPPGISFSQYESTLTQAPSYKLPMHLFLLKTKGPREIARDLAASTAHRFGGGDFDKDVEKVP